MLSLMQGTYPKCESHICKLANLNTKRTLSIIKF